MSVMRSSQSRMAPELWLHILQDFVPSGAPTTATVQPSRPELRPHVLEYRRTLWTACLVSRQVGTIARACLYKAVLINNCHELLCFFTTLRTVPALRPLVRSFSWTGTLPQSDADDVECVDLMPSLTAVFAALPPPVTAEEALLHKFLHADNLADFRAHELLAAVLAILPKLTTLFLVLGRLMPAPGVQQRIIDIEFGGGGTAEERANLLRLRQDAYEFLAIRALTMEEELIPTYIGYPVLPELQVLILDHISNAPPLFDAFNGEVVVDDLKRLCPQLRYIQSKGSVHLRWCPEPLLPSASMRRLLVRKMTSPASEIPPIHEVYPNLISLRIVVFNGGEFAYPNPSFEALTRFRYLQHLSLSTPHDLTWSPLDSHPTMSPFLRRMASLQHLRVDLVWLAARSDPSQLLHIASFLPRSIKSLHLLDYWGYDMTSPDRDRYPEFPDDMLPVDFLHLVLESLLEGYLSMGLISLREVKLSSPDCARDRLLWTAAHQSRQSLTRRFWQAGISLTFTGLQEARDEEEGWWLDLD